MASKVASQVPLAPWYSGLMRSMQHSPGSAGVITMATVENGKPRARTVLMGHLVKGDDGRIALTIKTSASSRKVRDADSDQVEMVYWLEETYMQYRFSGPITYEGHEKERAKKWSSLGPGEQEQFYFPLPAAGAGASPMDTSTSGAKFQKSQAAFREARLTGAAGPPDSFLLGVLYPDEVDVLNLGTLERQQYVLAGDGSGAWTQTEGYAPPVVSTV